MKLLSHPESSCVFVGSASRQDYEQDVDEVDASDLPAGTAIQLPLGVSTVLPSFDFETYSEAGYYIDEATGKVRGRGPQGKGGLPLVGAPAYAEHPSTEILCLYYDLKDGKGRRPWVPGGPPPTALLDYIRNGGHIEAFNAEFEFLIWNMIGVRVFGWPPLPLEQCHCAMAKAKAYGVGGGLAVVAKALGVEGKDPAGDMLIRKLCRPLTTTKNRKAYRWTLQTALDYYLALYRYCDRDLVAEDNVSAMLPDLSPAERAIWLTDKTINARGVQVDTAALDGALDILGQAERKYTAELSTITGGAVNSVSEVAKLREWLATQGIHIPDVKKETVTETLKRTDLPPLARRALEIRDILGAANVKKLRTLAVQVNSDGRLRGQYMYAGADRTRRWSAGGVQLQNMTAKGPKSCECEACGGIFGADAKLNGMPACPRCGSFMFHARPEWDVDAVEWAIRDILSRDLNTIEAIWGDPITLLCGCLRGLFIAREGYKLICCDFSAIEAVVAACLARCQWRIDVFSTHAKIYEQSAANASGTPFEEILQYKKDTGMHHPARKTIGKVRELAGGYGGWVNAWKNFGADEFMTDDEIKADVLKWREESPEIVEMWGGQYKWCGPGKWDYRPELFGLEGAAINAILNPGKCFSHIDVTYGVVGDVLHCRLPSGGFLAYHRPRLATVNDRLNRGLCYQITYEGYNSNSQKGPVGWQRMDTYGGRLFENVVQAVARDLQAEALKRCEARGYPIVMHTHDEGTAEVPEGFGSVDEMAEIMTERPEWASWWPIRAAGWTHKRYQKD